MRADLNDHIAELRVLEQLMVCLVRSGSAASPVASVFSADAEVDIAFCPWEDPPREYEEGATPLPRCSLVIPTGASAWRPSIETTTYLEACANVLLNASYVPEL